MQKWIIAFGLALLVSSCGGNKAQVEDEAEIMVSSPVAQEPEPEPIPVTLEEPPTLEEIPEQQPEPVIEQVKIAPPAKEMTAMAPRKKSVRKPRRKPTPPSAEKIVQQLLERVEFGQTQFEAPSTLEHNAGARARLVLDTALAYDAMTSVIDDARKKQFSQQVDIRLTGALDSTKAQTRITGQTSQLLGRQNQVNWEWNLKAVQTGTDTLTAGITMTVEVDGEESARKVISQLDHKLEIVAAAIPETAEEEGGLPIWLMILLGILLVSAIAFAMSRKKTE